MNALKEVSQIGFRISPEIFLVLWEFVIIHRCFIRMNKIPIGNAYLGRWRVCSKFSSNELREKIRPKTIKNNPKDHRLSLAVMVN